MNREEWRPFLERWSEEWIAGHEPGKDAPLDEEVVRDGWLGFAPATAEEVAAAEARLGRALPPSLREFLLVTNGWRDAGNFIYRLAGTAELAWLADTEDAHWIEAYETVAEEYEEDEDAVAEAGILRRGLRLSLDGDAAIMFLDPEDVAEDGEWAAYWLSSWSGMGPEPYASFHELMYRQYSGFHSLRQPPGETRDHWDAEVERARTDALAGGIEGPLEVLEEAGEFGRRRARVLRFQLLAMLGQWDSLPLSHVFTDPEHFDDQVRDPLFRSEIVPLLFAEDRITSHHECFTLQHLMRLGSDPIAALLTDYGSRRCAPDFRLTFGNREFDDAVHRIVDRLAADPAFRAPEPAPFGTTDFVVTLTAFTAVDDDGHDVSHTGRGTAGTGHGGTPPGAEDPEEARQRLIDAAWPELREAMTLWRPVSEDHIAPVSLFAEPILAEMLTPERGREILAMRRG